MSERRTATPGQTVGPFFHDALTYAGGPELVSVADRGAIRLHGRVLDGAGEGVPDALLEIWQPDADGRLQTGTGSFDRDPHGFTGWGRAATDRTGGYRFTTVNPGSTGEGAAPFIAVVVLARGLLNRLFTRIYLPEDATALASDPLLSSLPKERRTTLVATREPDGGLRFDVRLQGPDETVFLVFPEHTR